MKFQSPAKALQEPLIAALGATDGKTLPVLAHLLLRTDDNALWIIGSDLEMQLMTIADSQVSQNGAICVPARKLADIVRMLPGDALVQAEVKDGKFSIKANKSRFSMATLAADTFPVFDNAQYSQEVKVPAETLRHLLEKTAFAMAKNDVRHYLNGLFLQTENGILRAVASNGHQLALCEAALKTPEPLSLIVSRKGIAELNRLAQRKGEFDLRFSPNSLKASIGEVELSLKLIEGKFPDFRRHIPTQFAHTLVADRAALVSALERAALMADEKFAGVHLSVDAANPSDLLITASNSEGEDAEEHLEIELEGAPFEAGFNANYLLEALKHVDSPRAVLGFPDGCSSCLITDETDESFRFVIMPIRL